MYVMSFEEQLTEQKLSPHTIKIHMRNLDRYDTIGKTQLEMIQQIQEQPTLSLKQSVAGTFSKYLQYKKKPNEQVVQYLKSINNSLREKTAEKNKTMAEDKTLPNTKQLSERMNELYDKEDWRGYCVMYLMLTYQVRNMDMMAKVVGSIKDTDGIDNWFVVGKSQVKWIRNKYKTSSVFGQKVHIIKNKKFNQAIGNLTHLLSPNDNVDRVMKKITGGYTEGTIAKIVLRDNDSINGLNRVSKNRGTDITKLAFDYNITLPEAEGDDDDPTE